MRRRKKGLSLIAVTAAVCAFPAAPAMARALEVRVAAPATSVTGKPCRVTVRVDRMVHATVVLQERRGVRWPTVGRARLRHRSVKLR